MGVDWQQRKTWAQKSVHRSSFPVVKLVCMILHLWSETRVGVWETGCCQRKKFLISPPPKSVCGCICTTKLDTPRSINVKKHFLSRRLWTFLACILTASISPIKRNKKASLGYQNSQNRSLFLSFLIHPRRNTFLLFLFPSFFCRQSVFFFSFYFLFAIWERGEWSRTDDKSLCLSVANPEQHAKKTKKEKKEHFL